MKIVCSNGEHSRCCIMIGLIMIKKKGHEILEEIVPKLERN